MTVEGLLIEWQEHCRRYEIDLNQHPTPDFWHDLIVDLEYERASLIDDLTDKQIADNVRACLWLRDIGTRWDGLDPQLTRQLTKRRMPERR